MSDMIVTVVLGLFVLSMLPMVVSPFLSRTTRPVSTSPRPEFRPIRPVSRPVTTGSDQTPIAA
ncbi:MAG TPA: hypothetical protein VGT61_09410 [Thermomicrobiales bacterium]|jgi:hypothetical protein|nr:hypothetical protein [Thermomicrobiales bacterium]